jgi:tRNA-dihydrouridine synthase C
MFRVAAPWASIEPLLSDFWRQLSAVLSPRDRIGRLRQWVNYLRQRHPEAEVLWQLIRQESDIKSLNGVLRTRGECA